MKSFIKNIVTSRWVLLFLILVTVIIYAMNLIVPFFNDDLEYQYYHGANGLEHYSSIWQVFHATYLSYFTDTFYTDNGRLACTFFIRLYTGLLGETTFDIVNTFVFLFLLLYIGYYCIPRGKEKYLECWVAIVGCLFIFTQGTRTFSLYYWAAGAGTYLWASIWAVTFMLVLRWTVKHQQATWWQYALLVLSGAVCGMGHEMFSFALSAACFIYFFLLHRDCITKPLLALVLTFMVFSVVNAFSPAIQTRGGFSDGEFSLSMVDLIRRLISNLMELKAFYIMLACLFFFYYKERRIIASIKNNAFLFIALFFSFIPPMLYGSGGRALYGIEFFSILILTKLIGTRDLNNMLWSKIVALLFILYFGVVTYESYKKWGIVKEVVENYYHSDSDTQYFDAYVGTPLTDYYSINSLIFLTNELTKDRYGMVKRTEYGYPNAQSLNAVPCAQLLTILDNCHEQLDDKYLIPGDLKAYNYPELKFIVIQCDDEKLKEFYEGKTRKVRHLKFWPYKEYVTSSSHKYDCEVSDSKYKYKYVLLQKSYPFMTYDDISMTK